MSRKVHVNERVSTGQGQNSTESPSGLDNNTILKYQWKQLNHISTDAIATIIKKITDKAWVLEQCVSATASDDYETYRVLLEHGLQLTETVMDDIVARCELGTRTKIDWIRAAASGEPLDEKSSKILLSASLSEDEVLACKYRWYLIKYLNRLKTHQELTAAEKESRSRDEAKLARMQKQKSNTQDPFDPLRIVEQETEPLSNVPLITGTYHSFRDLDLAGQACVFAEAGFIEGARILLTRHNRETWPWRLAIVGRIPEACPIESYKDLLPQISPTTHMEQEWPHDRPWRDMDWVEVAELRQLVFGSANHELDAYMEQLAVTIEERKAAHGGDEAAVLDMAVIQKEAEELLPSPADFPASNERLSQWYMDRALAIDRNAGQSTEARRLIRWGIDNRIPGLERISEDLEILCKILYEMKPENRNAASRALWSNTVLNLSLLEFAQMDPMQVVKLCLAITDRETIVNDIRQLVLPYLTVIVPRRWQRQDSLFTPGLGLPAGLDPKSAMSYLYAYLLSQSPEHLSWVGAVVEASKPVYELEERILSNDMELAWLTLSCMYGCRSVNEWKVMSDMIVCLPIFDQTEDVDEAVDKVRRAELRKDIFLPGGDPLQSETHERPRISHQIDPIHMYPAFVKYAPTPGLMQHALDTLEQHLTAAETLARYDLPVPLSWFLENSDSEVSQQQMITKMARLASGGPEKMGERFESDDEWMLLLEDLIRLRGGENGGGVLGLTSEQDIYREYLAGVLSCGKFGLAKAILFPPGLLPPLRLATAEKLVIDCSNEMYSNATSGNRHQGLMKMAYECLQVLPETTNIRREMDLIEATHFMTFSYNLTAPNSNATILPIQIRNTEDKLSLVRRLIMTTEKAYRDHAAMLELAIKVTGSTAQKKSVKQQIEIQVVCMLIESSLNQKDYAFSIQQSERLMDLLRVTGALDLMPDGSPKVKRVTKSNSFNHSENSTTTPSSDISAAGAVGNNKLLVGGVDSPLLTTASKFPRNNKNTQSPESAKPWGLFLRVGSESVGRDYAKRLLVIGFALASCPAEKIQSVLEIWQSLETESIHSPRLDTDLRRSGGGGGGVGGFISTVMDRTGSGLGSMSTTHSNNQGTTATGHGQHNTATPAIDRTGGQGPLADIINRSRSPHSSQDPRRENSMNSEHSHVGEGGRRRDKLKSLVGSIWNA
ncbi:hypothetical protein BGZ94_008619 [Podila epigama]|nr:hypothetical protein BGZ94_008619 [Podila epigama]